MPRLETFTLEITNGENGAPARPMYSINGFPIEFESYVGSSEKGETFKLTGSPQSFPHSLTLSGPDEGTWDIESIEAIYYSQNEEPYTVRMGAVSLDEETCLNIWHERPLPVFDV